MIDVKLDFGATGDGNTNDTDAIRRALQMAIDENETLLFPPGRYRLVGNGDTLTPIIHHHLSPDHRLCIVGRGSPIIFACGKGLNRQMFYFDSALNGISVEGIEFDGNYSVQRIFEVASGLREKEGVATFIDCKFRRGRQTNATQGTMGLRLYGGFSSIHVCACTFSQFRSEAAKKEKEHTITAVGLAVSPDPRDLEAYANHVIIDKCTVADISSASGDDANGISVSTLYKIDDPDDPDDESYLSPSESSLVVRNCRFVDCRTRSIKSQTRNNCIVGNRFFHLGEPVIEDETVHCDIDLQFSGGTVAKNYFRYDKKPVNAAIGATVRYETNSRFEVVDNIIKLKRGTVADCAVHIYLVGNNKPANKITLAGNKVFGKVNNFLVYWFGDSGDPPVLYGHQVIVSNNVLNARPLAFFKAHSNYSEHPEVRGSFVGNQCRVKFPRPLPVTAFNEHGVVIKVDYWALNSGIETPPGWTRY